ncbi:uncharacterized protein [Elaeis guineensis]|uniref:Uncharacterized protein LOC105039142 isoform X2 n=1 Tax=Elaeis guineensis var. tenera TaxID=51953 RepID=A0A6I9QR07_ELAGV|nr:uncharacterized protein LOC105039142 isoform X2 [Elaeis guineensis]
MSVWCGRISVPALSSHLHSFGHRRRRSLPFLLKHLTTATTLTKATALPPERNGETPPTSTYGTTFLSSPTLQNLSPRQKDQISLYVSTLLQWNQRMNLTAVTEEREVMTRHVEDSLAILPPLQRSYLSHCSSSSSSSSCDGLNLVDVGSGPGLPGLIFAIACPSWKVTLLESMHKRCLFLEHIVDLTGLSNVQILRERAEEEVKVAENAIRLMGASILELSTVESHGPLGQRTVVICLKDRATPRKYPRHPGVPSKMPL